MPELKNNFLKSKMNKDLDERLIPNGEYRDALGVNIRQSEGPNVGALEVVQGNQAQWSLNPNMRFIGRFDDEINNTSYFFATDYNGTSRADSSTEHKIISSVGGGSPTVLVEGYFLNFSQQSIITGVSLLENLLFFTDNRNQPRVIDITQSLGYYTKEEHISVSKFSPYKPISVLQEREQDVINFVAPSVIEVDAVGASTDIDRVKKGDVIYNVTQDAEYGHVVSVNYATNQVTSDRDLTVEVPPGYTTIKQPVANDVIRFIGHTMSDESDDPLWPGDPDFLEDKFVRFSYRFKYANNEYSLVAPWTQPIFIPDQDGFFIEDLYTPAGLQEKNLDNENNAYKSTILNFFKNRVNNVVLYIPFPSNDPIVDYKIDSVEILYKESDAVAQKVVEQVDVNGITFSTYKPQENYYAYTYQSKKPYKSLAENVTTRVADKVPVKALGQEIISNRVVYANFADRYDPPSLSYVTQSGPRTPEFGNDCGEYPNHTLKQNRNYSIGVVLYDKYGRASTVIISDVVPASGEKISTLYHPYKTPEDVGYDGFTGVYRTYDWLGDGLRINFLQPITEAPSSNYPGTYAESTTFTLDAGNTTTITAAAPFTYTIVGADFTAEMPVDYYLRGYHVDYTKIISSTLSGLDTVIVTEEQIADIYEYTGGYPGLGTLEPKQSYVINPEGWYSYRIVVQQTEQDYYNVYLPGLTNGFPYNSAYLRLLTGGSTYTLANNVATTTTGSGQGMTVDILEVDINGGLRQVRINQNGIGYQVGDSITLTGGSATGSLQIQPVPNASAAQTGKLATTPLISDNINKIPRDLSEVGPDQKQYRSSSVKLYLRVNNTNVGLTGTLTAPGTNYTVTAPSGSGSAPCGVTGGTGTGMTVNIDSIGGGGAVVTFTISDFGDGFYVDGDVVTIDCGDNNATITLVSNPGENLQFFPGKLDHYAAQIGSEVDLLNANDNTFVTSVPFEGYYGGDGNPLIAVIDTDNQSVGVTYTQWETQNSILPRLSVYETEPVDSLLDLYYESSTTGLISDLNDLISNTFVGVLSLSPISSNFPESTPYTGTPTAVTNTFTCLDATGGNASGVNASIFKVVDTDGTGADVTALNYFTLNQTAVGPPQDEFEIECQQDFVYTSTSGGPTGVDKYVITIETELGGEVTYHDITVDLTNATPQPPSITASLGPSGHIEIFDFDSFVTSITNLKNGGQPPGPTGNQVDLVFDLINEQRISPGPVVATNIFTNTPVVYDAAAFSGGCDIEVDDTQTTAGEIYQITARVRDAAGTGFGALTATTTFTVEIKTGPVLLASSACVGDNSTGYTCAGSLSRPYVPKGGFKPSDSLCASAGDFTCPQATGYPSSTDSTFTVFNINNALTNLEGTYVQSIIAAGTGYTAGVVYPVVGGSGSNMTITVNAVTGAGGVTSATVNNPGLGYSNGDVVTLTGPSSNCQVELNGTFQTNFFVFAVEAITPNTGALNGNEFFCDPSRPAGRNDEILFQYRDGGTCATGTPFSMAQDYNSGSGLGDPAKAYGIFNLSGGSTSKVINAGIENIFEESWKNCSTNDTIAGPCASIAGAPMIGTVYHRIKIKPYDPTNQILATPRTGGGSITGWTYFDNNLLIAERTIGWVASDMQPYWAGAGTCQVGFNDPRSSRLFTCGSGTPSFNACVGTGTCCP